MFRPKTSTSCCPALRSRIESMIAKRSPLRSYILNSRNRKYPGGLESDEFEGWASAGTSFQAEN